MTTNNKDNTNATALATTSPAQAEWVLLQKQCNAFIQSGFLPDHIAKNCKSPQEAIARAVTIAWKGRELGIPPLQAFSSIGVINGKPCLSAELMLALCYQRVPGFAATFSTPPERQNVECTLTLQRKNGQPQAFRFTIEDAQRAGVVRPNSPWTKFPAAMLRARAISAACRAVCPDAIMGCYTPEEMGGEVMEGEIVEQTSSVAPTPTPAASTASAPPPAAPMKRNAETVGTIGDWDKAKPGWEGHPCTEAQIRRLYALGKNHGYSHDELKSLAYDLFQKEHLEELTKHEIQVLFQEFEGQAAPKPAETTPAAPAVGSDEDIAAAAQESAATEGM